MKHALGASGGTEAGSSGILKKGCSDSVTGPCKTAVFPMVSKEWGKRELFQILMLGKL